VTTAVVSLFTLSPLGQQQIASKMLLSAGTYVSNIALIGSGYFALESRFNPLLHLWSLAVEEQFYLAWGPMVLGSLLVMRTSSPVLRRAVKPLLIGLLIASLCLYILLNRHESEVSTWWGFRLLHDNGILPSQLAFYLPITRAWEFGAGAILALQTRDFPRWPKDKWVREAGFVISLVLLSTAVFGIFGFAEISTIAVVVSTTSLIYFSGQLRYLTFLLENRVMVGIGDISYSIYLWHWPIWVLLSAVFMHSALLTGSAVLLTMMLATVQYRYFEHPIRQARKLKRIRGRHMVMGFVMIALTGSVMMSQLSPLIANRIMGTSEKALVTHIVEKECDGRIYVEGTASSCWYGDEEAVGLAILVGDSQAKSLSDGFVAAALNLKMRALVLYQNGCAFLTTEAGIPCINNEWRQDMWSALESLSPNIVVVANLNYLYTDENAYKDISTEEARVWWGKEMSKTLSQIKTLGSKPVLVQPPPKFAIDFRNKVSLLNQSFASEDQSIVLARTKSVQEEETRAVFANDSDQQIINFDKIICSSGICSQFIDGNLAYEDPSHLSQQGSLAMTNLLEEQMRIAILSK
jgi:peptidoglycan/LPS O-acetylase OafA/YrhL